MNSRLYRAIEIAGGVILGALGLGGALSSAFSAEGVSTNRIASKERAESSMTARETSARVDDACARAWEQAGLEPRPSADPLTVARRLSLGLTGTIPSLEEIRALERREPSAQVDAHLDHLLSDRRFADYWAERLARAWVGTDNGPPFVFRRRRFVYWLSDALAVGRPYDAIVRELIAAEGLWTDAPATNFVTSVERDPIKLAGLTARAFLGVRLDCAQCHDHPFAQWKQSDFEGLAAFFAGIEQGINGVHDAPTALMVEDPAGGNARQVEPKVPFAEGALEPNERPRVALAGWLTSADNDHFSEAMAHRVWVMMMGKGLTHTVDDIEPEPLLADVLPLLADDFREHQYDLRRLIRIIAQTQVFRMRSFAPEEGSLKHAARFASFPVTALRGEQIAGALVQLSSVRTVDAESHVLSRLMRSASTEKFVERYGDAGTEELSPQSGTIMQRLVMMNGEVVRKRIEANIFSGAGRISALAEGPERMVELAFLIALTRRPSEVEMARYLDQLGDSARRRDNHPVLEDLLWALVNSTEFSWNH